MGSVYLATHLGTERYVALKLITPQFMRNEEFVERFQARSPGRGPPETSKRSRCDWTLVLLGPVTMSVAISSWNPDGCTLSDVLAEETRFAALLGGRHSQQVARHARSAPASIVHRDLKPTTSGWNQHPAGSRQGARLRYRETLPK